MDAKAWIFETADGECGRLAHIAEPWFGCAFARSPGEAGEFFGLTVEMESVFFHDFVWRNGIPHEDDIRRLSADAARIIEEIRAERRGSCPPKR